MKKIALAVVLLVSGCKGKGGGATAPTPAPGSADVKLSYADPKCDPSSEDCKCTGSIDDPSGLKDLGLAADDVKSGVVCVMGDFDGNGTKDLAIAGKGYDCDQDKSMPVRLVLTDKGKIMHAETLDTLGCIAPYALTKDEYPGVSSDRDAIEGTTNDGVDKVYYWNGTKVASQEVEEGD